MNNSYPYKKFEYIFNGENYIEPIVDINEYYKQTGSIDWNKRFTYFPKNSPSPKYDLSIIEFFKYHPEIITNIKEIKNARHAYKLISDIANEYVNWVFNEKGEIENEYLPLTKDGLNKWAKGMLGEYFWFSVLNEIGTVYIQNKNGINDVLKFRNICHPFGNDFGVDAIGEVEIHSKNSSWKIHNCVFQFKFWNPNIDDLIFTETMAQKISDDGIRNKFISPNEHDTNIFVCWLGTDKKVSKWIERNELLAKSIRFIDLNAINKSESNIMYANILDNFKKLI